MCLTAVRNNGMALKYVDDELICDREIALAAVTQNGLALEYFLPVFRDHRSRSNSGISSTAKSTDANSTVDDNEGNSKENDLNTIDAKEKNSVVEIDYNQVYKEVIMAAGKLPRDRQINFLF